MDEREVEGADIVNSRTVKIDLRTFEIKPIHAQWLMKTHGTMSERPDLVQNDGVALETKTIDELSQRTQRFQIKSMGYTYMVMYIVGENLTTADELSHTPVKIPEPNDMAKEANAIFFIHRLLMGFHCLRRREELKTAQQCDPNCSTVVQYCRDDCPKNNSWEEVWVFLGILLLSCILALENGIDKGTKICTRGHAGLKIVAEKGDYGFIVSTGYPGNYSFGLYHGQSCNVQIKACSTCRLKLTFMKLGFPKCHSKEAAVLTPRFKNLCIPGCDHINTYEVDEPYSGATRRKYLMENEGQKYTSISANLMIVHCMSNGTRKNGKKFRVRYEVIDKSETKEGTVRSNDNMGHVTSPNFPNGYALNAETFSYTLQNLDPYGHVRLVFDDWDIAPESGVHVYDGLTVDSPVIELDRQVRPVLVSKSSTVIIVFSTGLKPGSCCKYKGFKVTYQFVSDDDWQEKPETACSTLYPIMIGGTIRFRGKSLSYPQFSDCVWILKRYSDDYPDGVVLKLKEVEFGKGWLQYGDNSLQVHRGLTSVSPLLVKYTATNITEGPHWFTTEEGFYIRLRGTFFRGDMVTMVFTAVNNVTDDGCMIPTDYLCHNLWCIDNKLRCDGVDHCGDNSDEGPALACTVSGMWSFNSDWSHRSTLAPCHGGYICQRDSSCVPRSNVCDGIVQCPDASDEINCDYGINRGLQIQHCTNMIFWLWIGALLGRYTCTR
ncbi:hypothetical protein ScPMuIL_000979 [Solemya velum]